jgi:hypothetical protein
MTTFKHITPLYVIILDHILNGFLWGLGILLFVAVLIGIALLGYGIYSAWEVIYAVIGYIFGLGAAGMLLLLIICVILNKPFPFKM